MTTSSDLPVNKQQEAMNAIQEAKNGILGAGNYHVYNRSTNTRGFISITIPQQRFPKK